MAGKRKSVSKAITFELIMECLRNGESPDRMGSRSTLLTMRLALNVKAMEG